MKNTLNLRTLRSYCKDNGIEPISLNDVFEVMTMLLACTTEQLNEIKAKEDKSSVVIKKLATELTRTDRRIPVFTTLIDQLGKHADRKLQHQLKQLELQIKELDKKAKQIGIEQATQPIDMGTTDITPGLWIQINEVKKRYYNLPDGKRDVSRYLRQADERSAEDLS